MSNGELTSESVPDKPPKRRRQPSATGRRRRPALDVRPRDAVGRFVGGVPGPKLTTGFKSALVKSGAVQGREADVAAMRRQLREELDAAGVVKSALADTFVEVDSIRCYLAERVEHEGPLTGKGRTRAVLSCYLSVVDRLVKLATLLGLDRRMKQIDPLVAVRRAVAEANEPEAGA